MTFEELGALLRSEREKRRLSVERVADELKINARILAALEAGDATRLPPPAYTRGFIRTYSAYLGFSGEEIHNMADAVELKYIPRDVRKTAQAKPQQPVADAKKTRQPKGNGLGALYAGMVIAAVLGGGGYWLWSSGRLPWPDIKQETRINSIEQLPDANAWQPSARQTPAQPEAAPAALPAPPSVEAPENSPSLQPVPEKRPVTAQQDTVSDDSAASGEDKKELASPEKVSAEEKKPEAPTHHKLIITATEECWVHSRADKTDTRQFSLRKGDTFALTFAKSLELKLGNAGGVALRYDGSELPPPGTSGQVKTLVFPLKENND